MRTVRVGIIGLGTVGQGVVELLRRNEALYGQRCGARVEVTAALVRDGSKARQFAPAGALVTADPATFWGHPFDVLVEVAGGVDGARQAITRGLEAGKDVVTANKALLAEHGEELFALAEARRRFLMFEAAVAGGVPVIQTIARALAANRVIGFAGILNGTCNFILTHMARGVAYEAALAQAQRLGFAEADPTLDVSGRDSLEKLSILATLAFGGYVAPRVINSEGITKLTADDLRDAGSRGHVIKLLACARLSPAGLDLWNGPTLVPASSPLASVTGSDMALLVRGDAVSHTFLGGDGAGRFPTASAVVGDILEVARQGGSRPEGRLNPWPVGAAAPTVAPLMETIDQSRRGALMRVLPTDPATPG